MKRILNLITIIFITPIIIYAQGYSGGGGTSGSPYIIANKNDLQYLSEHSGDWGKYFKQTADLSFATSEFQNGGAFYNGGGGFIPIGNGSPDFTGGYDGNGHTISGLYINRHADYQGFFGMISGAEIKDLGIIDADITASNADRISVLVGIAYSSSTISRCYVTGTLSGDDEVGGICGQIETGSTVNISDCYSNVNVDNATGSYVGGFVGDIRSGQINTSYSAGSVSATGNNVGGLVGHNIGIINNSYSTGSVNGGGDNVGGLAGYNNTGTISNSYSIGSVNGSGSDFAGFVGSNTGTVSNSFWNTDSAGATGISGGTTTGATGKTTSEMKTQSTFTDAGWDFTNTWSIGSGKNNGYAYLQNVTPLPVELSSLSANVKDDKVELKWQTATEVNNHGFEILRRSAPQNDSHSEFASANEESWAKIGFVEGHGNSNSPKSYSFTDQPTGGTKFSYRLKQIDNDGKYKYYDAITVTLNNKTEAELIGNYPNPFNPSTKIKFYLPETENVSIKIYDVLGREVKSLINKQTESGYHIVYWNGRDDFGRAVSSGVYIYRLQAAPSAGSTGSPSGAGETFIQTKKMALLK